MKSIRVYLGSFDVGVSFWFVIDVDIFYEDLGKGCFLDWLLVQGVLWMK